jgi:hypothetical protein
MSVGRWLGIQRAIEKAGSLTALGLTQTQYLVLECLADHENDGNGECDPSSETVALKRGLHQDTVRKSWRKLKAGGHIYTKSKRMVSYTKPNGQKADGWVNNWGFDETRYSKVMATWAENASGTHKVNPENAPGTHKPSLNQREVKEVIKAIDSPLPFSQEELGKAGGEVEQFQKGKGRVMAKGKGKQNGKGKGEPVGSAVASAPACQGAVEEGTGEPMGTEVASAPPEPEALTCEEEGAVVHRKDEKGPTLPVMLRFLHHLQELGIAHPRRKKSWHVYESRLKKRYSDEEQEEFMGVLDWAFTREFWLKVFIDPRKEDLIKCFVDNTGGMWEDFDANWANAKREQELPCRTEASQQPGPQSSKRAGDHQGASSLGGASNLAAASSLPAGFEDRRPMENYEPTLPLGKLFQDLLADLGIMSQDTSSWDDIESWMSRNYTPAQLQEAPGAMKLILTPGGKENFWTKAMLNGTKANLFAFFARNFLKILNDTQLSKARTLLNRATNLEEIKSGTRKTFNKYA